MNKHSNQNIILCCLFFVSIFHDNYYLQNRSTGRIHSYDDNDLLKNLLLLKLAIQLQFIIGE